MINTPCINLYTCYNENTLLYNRGDHQEANLTKLYELDYTQRLPIELPEAWDFFSRPENPEWLTPPEMNFKITHAAPTEIHAGAIIGYTVTPLLGIPLTWVSEITQVIPQQMFIDQQRLGPYRMWHHQHWFKAIPGGVEIRDWIHYILPLAPFSQLFHGWVVGRPLRQVFEYRQRALEKRFGKWQAPPE